MNTPARVKGAISLFIAGEARDTPVANKSPHGLTRHMGHIYYAPAAVTWPRRFAAVCHAGRVVFRQLARLVRMVAPVKLMGYDSGNDYEGVLRRGLTSRTE